MLNRLIFPDPILHKSVQSCPTVWSVITQKSSVQVKEIWIITCYLDKPHRQATHITMQKTTYITYNCNSNYNLFSFDPYHTRLTFPYVATLAGVKLLWFPCKLMDTVKTSAKQAGLLDCTSGVLAVHIIPVYLDIQKLEYLNPLIINPGCHNIHLGEYFVIFLLEYSTCIGFQFIVHAKIYH